MSWQRIVAIAILIIFIGVYMGWFLGGKHACEDAGGAWVATWPKYSCIDKEKP